MHNELQTRMSLVLSKYESIEDITELILLLEKEFNVKYSEEDILNYYTNITDLEIENRKIDYGYFNEYTEFNLE